MAAGAWTPAILVEFMWIRVIPSLTEQYFLCRGGGERALNAYRLGLSLRSVKENIEDYSTRKLFHFCFVTLGYSHVSLYGIFTDTKVSSRLPLLPDDMSEGDIMLEQLKDIEGVLLRWADKIDGAIDP